MTLGRNVNAMPVDGYIVISNLRVQPVTIIKREKGFIIVEFPGQSQNTRIRVRESRLFSTEEEAKEHTHEYNYETVTLTDSGLVFERKKEPCFYVQGY